MVRVPVVGAELPSYNDDLHYAIYDERQTVSSLDKLGMPERMEDLLDMASVVLKEAAKQ